MSPLRTGVFLVLVLATPSLRAAAHEVVLAQLGADFSDERWPEAEAQLELELASMGFTVVRVPSSARQEGQKRRELEEMAAASDATAAVSLRRSVYDGSVEVLWVERVTDKASFRRLETKALSAREAPRIVAMRAVELLRASLVELRLAQAAVAASKAAPLVKDIVTALVLDASGPAPAAPEVGRIELQLGVSLRRAVLGDAAAPVFAGEVRWGFLAPFSLVLGGRAGSREDTVRTAAGGASVRAEMASAGLAGLWRASDGLGVGYGVGVEAIFVRARGEASAPFVSRTKRALVWTPRADLRLVAPLTPRLAAVVQGGLGWVTAPVRLEVFGARVGKVRGLTAEAGLALEVSVL